MQCHEPSIPKRKRGKHVSNLAGLGTTFSHVELKKKDKGVLDVKRARKRASRKTDQKG